MRELTAKAKVDLLTVGVQGEGWIEWGALCLHPEDVWEGNVSK